MAMSVGSAIGYLDLDTSKFQSALKTASSQLKGFTDSSKSTGDRITSLGSGLKTMGQNMTKYVTTPLTGLGTASVMTAATFEKSMSNVQALSGATGKDLEDLTNIAKEMGAKTQFSASEAADALGYMALAGWDSSQSMSALPGVLDLAAASNMGLAEASDMVTDYLSAFGEEADQAGRMSDVLAYAQANSNTTTQALGEAFKNCAVNANSFGLDIEQTTALLGKLGDQGLKGSEAGTALNAVFRDMSSKMKDGAIAIGDTNVKITDANGNFKSMAEIVAGVQKATDGLSESEKMVALQSTFTSDSIKAMGILMNTGSDSIQNFTNELYNSNGAASEMAATMNDNLSGQITTLKSALEGAAISIGEALLPMVKDLVTWINNLVTWFNSLSPSMQTSIVMAAGLAAAIGPVLIIIGQMSTGIGALVNAFSLLSIAKLKDKAETIALHLLYAKDAVLKAASTAATYAQIAATTAWNVVCGIATTVTTALGAAIAFLTSPIGLVVLAITALIAIGVLLYQNWDTIKAKCSEIWQNTIKPMIENVTNAIKSVITTVWNGIKSFLTTIWNGIKTLATTVWEGIKTLIELRINATKTVITTVWNAIKTVTSSVWNGIKTLISTVWNAIKSVVTTAVNGVKSVITSVFNAIKGVISSTSNGWKATLQAVWTGIKSVVSTGVNAVKSTISSIFSGIQSILTAPFKAAQSVISGILGGISSAISNVTSAIKNVTKLGKSMPNTDSQISKENNQDKLDTDYSTITFDYAKAKNTTISDVIASNYNMLETLKSFKEDIKTDDKKTNVSTENSFSINLNIDKFVNERKQDINQIADEIAYMISRKALV
jgi:TP901 family phage tail tape measure protein